MKKIGIFGGAFNPPHVAHAIIADDVREQFRLDKVLFIPSGVPPLKESEAVTAKHRLNMSKLAFENDKYFEISDIEIKNTSVKSFTVDTLVSLKESYQKEEIRFYLIIGTDNLIDFPKWKNPEKLFSLSEVIVINRPFFNLEDAMPEFLNKVTIAKVPLLEISSSMIRNYVRTGKSIKYLVHPDVGNYIRENKLYLS